MRKLIFLLIVLVVSLISCKRAMDLMDRIPIPPGVDTSKYLTKDTSCEIIAQSGSYIDQEPRSQMFGFRKVFNATTGRVDSLITATGGVFEVDSFFYTFEYLDSNIIRMDGVVKTYNRSNDMHIWELDNANMINEGVKLDSNGNALYSLFGQAVVQTFNYENGLLTSVDIANVPAPFSHYSITYDNNGNLVKIMNGDDNNNHTVTFEYDLSKTAKTQFYSPIAPFHLYEIMGWIPISPKNLRTRQRTVAHFTFEDLTTRDDIVDITYSNHLMNQFGVLESFNAHIAEIDLDTTITNTLTCSVDNNAHLPF